MLNPPTASIILPTYNRKRLLSRSIQSVLEQTYSDFELLIVDDCSTDDTEEFVRGLEDRRIVYVKHDRNRGAAAARNTGIRLARGKYLAFQDSDDEWEPNKLARQVGVLESTSNNVGIVSTDMWRTSEKSQSYWRAKVMSGRRLSLQDSFEQLRGVGIQTALIRGECFERCGKFNELLPRLIDFELFIRFSREYVFYHIPEPLVKFYDTGQGISTNSEAYLEAFNRICAIYFTGPTFDRKALTAFQFQSGKHLCSVGQMQLGSTMLLQAAKANLRNAKYVSMACLSLLGHKVFKLLLLLNIRLNSISAYRNSNNTFS